MVRKSDEDWQKTGWKTNKDMVIECGADIAELEIDREDVHDRKKWRKYVIKRKSNPIGKWTITR